MTNTTLLRQFINDSGKKMSYLANKLGISRYALLKKISNQNEFKGSEIVILKNELGLTNEQRDSIFFASEGEYNSTT